MESTKKYQSLARYIKLNGYLLLLVASYYAFDEQWELYERLTGQQEYNIYRFVFFRWFPLVRVIFAALWFVSILLAFRGLRSENCRFLQPAKDLLLLELFIFIAEMVIKAMKKDEERIYYRLNLLAAFTHTVFAFFVVHTVSALEEIFDGRNQLQQETMINMNLNSTTFDAVDTTKRQTEQ